MRTLVMLALAATTAAAQSDQPLTARLLPPNHGRLQYTVSDQAYVAIFALQRDSQPSLVYSSSAKRGETTIPGAVMPWRVAAYTGIRLDTWLVMVASRAPLDTRRFRASALTADEDWNDVIDRIVHDIAPPGAETASDVYLLRD